MPIAEQFGELRRLAGRGGVLPELLTPLELPVRDPGSTEWAVHQTMLHEIAHALVRYRSGHGPTWERVAQEIGCRAEFTRTHGKHTYLSLPGWRGRGIRLGT